MTGKNTHNQWRLMLRLFLDKRIWIPVLGFSISFAWLISSLGSCIGMSSLMLSPAVIRVECENLSSDIGGQILGLDEVKQMTTLSETNTPIKWNDYSGSVNVYGVEVEYLQALAAENMTSDMAFSEGMPYGVLCQSAAGQMVRTDKKAESRRDTAADNKSETLFLTGENLMSDVIISENTAIRLYGIIDDIKYSGNLPGLYISEQWFERIFEQTSAESGQNISTGGSRGMESEKAAGSSQSVNTQSLLIDVNHGFQVTEVLKTLAQAGINGSSQVTDMVKTIQEKSLTKLYTGMVVLICSICIMIYQDRLWIERHRAFCEDICRFYGNSRTMKQILWKKRLFIMAVSAVGSSVWQWLTVVLTA